MASIQAATVETTVTTQTKGFMALHKLQRGMSIMDLKAKFVMVTGIPAGCQKIEIFDTADKKVCDLDDNDKKLGAYPIEDHYRIHVTSTDPTGGVSGFAGITDFNDTTKVQKYEMDDDEYDKMTGTVRDIKRKRKEGIYNEEEMARKAALKAAKEKAIAERQNAAMAKATVDSRCKIDAKQSCCKTPCVPERRGTLRFKGEVSFAPGLWAGVELDEPFGKNDGSHDGKRYFTCKPKYGSFVKIDTVTCGDFPAMDDDGLDEFMDEI